MALIRQNVAIARFTLQTGDKLLPAMNPDFSIDCLHMGLDGVLRDKQRFADVGNRSSHCQQVENVAFSPCQGITLRKNLAVLTIRLSGLALINLNHCFRCFTIVRKSFRIGLRVRNK